MINKGQKISEVCYLLSQFFQKNNIKLTLKYSQGQFCGQILDCFLGELTLGNIKFIYSDKATNLNTFFDATGEKSLIVP